MNIVILAAGKNTRLDTGKPKSLIEIAGESLMHRHIRQFKALGVKKFCVISGHAYDILNDHIEDCKEALAVKIDVIHNDRYHLENGYSVYAAKEWVRTQADPRFFLTMGDHFLDPDLVQHFIEHSSHTDLLQLGVDKPSEKNQHIDLEDVTKVQMDKGYIASIGKGLETFDAYDTGLFKLDQQVFNYFERSFKDGRYSISDTVNALVKDKQARAIDVSGFYWNDVDNPEDLKLTLNHVQSINRSSPNLDW